MSQWKEVRTGAVCTLVTSLLEALASSLAQPAPTDSTRRRQPPAFKDHDFSSGLAVPLGQIGSQTVCWTLTALKSKLTLSQVSRVYKECFITSLLWNRKIRPVATQCPSCQGWTAGSHPLPACSLQGFESASRPRRVLCGQMQDSQPPVSTERVYELGGRACTISHAEVLFFLQTHHWSPVGGDRSGLSLERWGPFSRPVVWALSTALLPGHHKRDEHNEKTDGRC